MPSFDVVSKVDLAEVKNAQEQTLKELRNRFDFKGIPVEVNLDNNALVLRTGDEQKMKALRDVLESKLVRRGVSLKALQYGPLEPAAGGSVRQAAQLQSGIPTDKAREIVALIKKSKLKVQASIQGDQVRVSGKKRDDLQSVIAMLQDKDFPFDMQFVNMRD